MVNIWQWLGLASKPNEHKYLITDKGRKATESLDCFRKYECEFYILLHLKRFEEVGVGQDKGEIQEGLEPFYTGKETKESVKRLLKTSLIKTEEIGGNNQ